MKRFLAYVTTAVFTVFIIGPVFGQTAEPDSCYATVGGANGSLYRIDLESGAANLVGATGTNGLPGLAVDGEGYLYATTRFVTTVSSSLLYRIDASTGSPTLIGDTEIFAVDAIAFDSNGVLFGVDDLPALYTIDTTDASVTWIADLTHWYAGLAFDPIDGTLYGSTGGAFGEEDRIYTIDPATGTEVIVGTTGLGGATPDIAFDGAGNLFGFKGGGKSVNNLIAIDKGDGLGAIVGPLGVTRMSGFTCYSPDEEEEEAVDVFVDIKPQSCPNQLNTNGKNTVNVAILGTADFDVTSIDVGSLTLGGLQPYKYDYVDVSRPPLDDEPCACTADTADGFVDLQLKFKNQDILGTLGPLEDGDEFTLQLLGALDSETEIEGEDCIVIQKPNDNRDEVDKGSGLEPVPQAFELEQNYPNPFNPSTSIGFSLPGEMYVQLSVFNAVGQRVATLVSGTLPAGRHTVQWDATDDSGRSLSSGLYIYRISAGEFVQTQKMLLLE